MADRQAGGRGDRAGEIALHEVGDRVEELVGELGEHPDPGVGQRAEELVRLLMRLYGAALEHIMEIASAGGAASTPLVDRLVGDDLLSSLLILHGLHPLDTHERVRRALEQVRPYLGSHAGDVELLGIDDDVVRLRLEGSCRGCPSSAVTVKLAIERAISEYAPEVTGVEVEGAVEPDTGVGFIPLNAVGRPDSKRTAAVDSGREPA